jgi:ABC-type amino acid transport substrate-binding protein
MMMPDYKEKLSAFNHALRAMHQDGTLKQIMEKYGF